MKASKLSIPRRRPPVQDVLGFRNRVAEAQLKVGQVERELIEEEIVGDPHLVAVGVAAELQERRNLRLPPESSDPQVSGRAIGHQRGTTADPVAIEVERVLERQDGRIRNRFDQPGTEQWDRHTARDDVRVGRYDRLTAVGRTENS